MSASVVVTDRFQKKAKKLIKKYKSLSGEIRELIGILESEPRTGTKIGENTYKIRLAVKSKGKSGGVRIILYKILDRTLLLRLCS